MEPAIVTNKSTRIIAHAGSEDGEFQCKHALTEKPDDVPFHRHEAYEIAYLIAGNVYYHVENRSHRLKSRDLIIINSRELHSVEQIGESPYERTVIHFSTRFLRGFESPRYNVLGFLRKSRLGVGGYISGRNEDTSAFRAYLDEIERFVRNPAPESDVMIRTLFIQALVCLNGYFSNKQSNGYGEYDVKIAGILTFIENNLGENLSLSTLEARFDLSRYHLCRLFRRETGYTVHEYLTNKRIIHAVEMLNEGSTALEAADATGFNDYSNFYKAFRRVTGFKPHQFPNAFS